MYLRSHMRIPFVVCDGFCENPERIVSITLDNYDGGFQVGALFRRTGTGGPCASPTTGPAWIRRAWTASGRASARRTRRPARSHAQGATPESP